MNIGQESLKILLRNIKTIALIGASSNPDRDSYKVMKFLIEKGYEVFPVNPNESNNKILDIDCYSNIQEIKKKIDMVDIMVNVLYSELLCAFELNNEDAISSFELILLACSINIFGICSYYLLFKDYLDRKGQILFILLLSFHPYLAIYFPRFFTDLFV